MTPEPVGCTVVYIGTPTEGEDMNTFEVGDIVTEKPEYHSPRGKGDVVEVEEDGYVQVRFPDGAVLSFWPGELVYVGKLDPELIPVLANLNKALDAAQSTVYKLSELRKGVLTLAMKGLEDG